MPDTHSDLVVAATASSLQEAEVIRVVLESNGVRAHVPSNTASVLSHIRIAAFPDGIPIFVLPEDLPAAREALIPKNGITDEDWQVPTQVDEPETAREPTPDDYARRAKLFSLLYLGFPPLLLAAVYYFVMALVAENRQSVASTGQYQRNMLVALILGIIVPLVILIWWSTRGN